MMHLTSLDLTGVFAASICLVGAVFFAGGRVWERAGYLPDDTAANAMVDWVREVKEPGAARPALQLAPVALPVPPPPVPPPGPVRSYSALAAWRLEQETTRGADTSVTKLTACIVRGMAYRDQIDRRGAEILAEARDALAGDQAA